ncbi:MAG TPA: hypothetical protein VNQ76_23175 [Planctomicrobium sp.]|nr:hypothetical protein [Planctomicrobium sp.]
MMRYVGLDVHKQFIEACILNRQGKILARHRVECVREKLLLFAQKILKQNDRVALEATMNT